MAVSISWMDRAQSVILVNYDTFGNRTTPGKLIDSTQVYTHIQQMSCAAPHAVDTIVDFSAAHGAVPIQTLTQMRRASGGYHLDSGMIAFVSKQDTITRLIELMRRSSPSLAQQSVITRNRHDALAVIRVARRQRAHTA